MNTIDFVVLCIVLIGALWGLTKGAVRPLFGLVALLTAYLGGPALGDVFSPWLQDTFAMSAFMAGKVASYGGGLFLFFSVRFFGRYIERVLVDRVAVFKMFNRVGGTLLGSLQAGLLVLALFVFLAFLPQGPIRKHFPSLWNSESYITVRENNPFMNSGAVERLRELRSAVANPKRLKQLKESTKMKQLLNEYEIPKILDDPETLSRLKTGDYKALVENENIESLAKDKKLENLIDSLEDRE